MSEETADLLRRGKARIPTPKDWTKGCFGRKASGEPIIYSQDLSDAVCLCGYGALEIEYSQKTNTLLCAQIALDMAVADFPDFPSWQDQIKTTHADVLACFDRAIAAEEATP